jgi:hypothetical protein
MLAFHDCGFPARDFVLGHAPDILRAEPIRRREKNQETNERSKVKKRGVHKGDAAVVAAGAKPDKKIPLRKIPLVTNSQWSFIRLCCLHRTRSETTTRISETMPQPW